MASGRGAKTKKSGAARAGESSLPAARGVCLYEVPLGNDKVVVLSFGTPPLASAQLTSAERAVAVLAAEGLSTRAIASQRGASVRTVSNQLASIYEKLGVCSRGELAMKLTEAKE